MVRPSGAPLWTRYAWSPLSAPPVAVLAGREAAMRTLAAGAEAFAVECLPCMAGRKCVSVMRAHKGCCTGTCHSRPEGMRRHRALAQGMGDLITYRRDAPSLSMRDSDRALAGMRTDLSRTRVPVVRSCARFRLPASVDKSTLDRQSLSRARPARPRRVSVRVLTVATGGPPCATSGSSAVPAGRAAMRGQCAEWRTNPPCRIAYHKGPEGY